MYVPMSMYNIHLYICNVRVCRRMHKFVVLLQRLLRTGQQVVCCRFHHRWLCCICCCQYKGVQHAKYKATYNGNELLPPPFCGFSSQHLCLLLLLLYIYSWWLLLLLLLQAQHVKILNIFPCSCISHRC